MPRPLSVTGGGRQMYTPPIDDYRRKLGRKEVHAPVNKELRTRMRDRPAVARAADDTATRYTANALLAVAAAVVVAIALAVAALYGTRRAATAADATGATGAALSAADAVALWLPTAESPASHWIWFVFGVSALTAVAIAFAVGVFYAVTWCVPGLAAPPRRKALPAALQARAAANASAAASAATVETTVSAAASAAPTAPAAMEIDAYFVVSAAIGAFVIYWFFFRKANDGQTTFRQTAVIKDKQKAAADAKEHEGKPAITIFFGSQSGTAQTFAYELAEEAKSQGFNGKAVDLEGYENEDLANEKFVVFLMATFGEGEPTDNAAAFYEWLNAGDRQPGTLTQTTFSVFALGNRQYEHFCAIGHRVDKKLEEIGGKRLVEVGEGDDDGSLEEDYGNWKAKFWEATHAHFGTVATAAAAKPFAPSFTLKWTAAPAAPDAAPAAAAAAAADVKEVDDVEDPNANRTEHKLQTDTKYKPTDCIKCVVNRELRQVANDAEGYTRHIEFDVSKSPLRFQTADNLGVYPRNDYKTAVWLAKRLKVDFNAKFALKKNDDAKKPIPLPTVCSVKDALLWYCDTSGLARTGLLKTLVQYATDEKEKDQLTHLATDQKEAFLAEKWSVREVLAQFPSVLPPFNHFLEWCPKLTPRFYTISSSAKVDKTRVSVTVSLSQTDLPRGRRHIGTCSNYLIGLRPGQDSIWAFVRTSTFRLPRIMGAPLILVGPGTGVAPFRAWVQEATYWQAKVAAAKAAAAAAGAPAAAAAGSAGAAAAAAAAAGAGGAAAVKSPIGPITLFFGCRNSARDYIYKDELTRGAADGVISNLQVALSRESKDAKKVYVQDLMSACSEQLWRLVENDKASFYVCGGAAMGKAVREQFRLMVERFGKVSTEKANAYIERLQRQQRYISELWS